MTMPSAQMPPSPPYEESRRFAPEGLHVGSGFLVGLVAGAIGAWIAMKVGPTQTVRNTDPHVAYLAIFGSYGAILGGALLATDAARRPFQAMLGWFAGGALVGGAAAGLGSLLLVRLIVGTNPYLGGSPETVFTVAFALIFGSLGFSLGSALAALRGQGAVLVTGVLGGFVGAFGGGTYVKVVLFYPGIHSASDSDSAAIMTLAFIGAGIGAAIGLLRPSIALAPSMRSNEPSLPAMPLPPPLMPMPVVPWAETRPDIAPLPSEPVVATAAPSSLPAPSMSARSYYSLGFDDGRTYQITGRVIVGRDPQRQHMEDAYAQLVNIDDAAHTVSQTHFAVMLQDDRLFAEDRGSANGSMVVSPAGVQTLRPHATPIRIGEGWTVVFGACRAYVSRT